MPQQQQHQQNGLLPAPERRGLRATAAASAPSVVVSAQLPASIAAATTGAASAPRKCALGALTMCRQLRWSSRTFEMLFWRVSGLFCFVPAANSGLCSHLQLGSRFKAQVVCCAQRASTGGQHQQPRRRRSAVARSAGRRRRTQLCGGRASAVGHRRSGHSQRLGRSRQARAPCWRQTVLCVVTIPML